MKWTVWGWMDWNAEYSRVDKSHLHGQNAHGGLQWDSRARKRERGLKWKERVWSLQASKRPLVLWGWQRRKRTDSPNSQTFSSAMRLEERVRKLVLFARLLEKKTSLKEEAEGPLWKTISSRDLIEAGGHQHDAICFVISLRCRLQVNTSPRVITITRMHRCSLPLRSLWNLEQPHGTWEPWCCTNSTDENDEEKNSNILKYHNNSQ